MEKAMLAQLSTWRCPTTSARFMLSLDRDACARVISHGKLNWPGSLGARCNWRTTIPDSSFTMMIHAGNPNDSTQLLSLVRQTTSAWA
jgi:hypothetical protein